MNYFIKFLDLFVNWFECIINPIITCRKFLNSSIPDREKINLSLCIWFVGFILSFGLEIPIYYYYGLANEYSFYISYTIIGFFYLLIQSLFFHIVLIIFRIKSKYIDTLIIYSVIIGAYSPFYLLSSCPNTIKNIQLIRTIKSNHIDILNNIMQGMDMLNNTKLPTSVIFVSSIISIFILILFSIMGVFLSYLIMERYACKKFKSFLTITFAQLIIIFPLILLTLLKSIMLYSYL
jgi:hypothetical protein